MSISADSARPGSLRSTPSTPLIRVEQEMRPYSRLQRLQPGLGHRRRQRPPEGMEVNQHRRQRTQGQRYRPPDGGIEPARRQDGDEHHRGANRECRLPVGKTTQHRAHQRQINAVLAAIGKLAPIASAILSGTSAGLAETASEWVATIATK